MVLSEEKDSTFRGENRERKKRETEMAGPGDLQGPVARPGMREEEASGALATCWSGAVRDLFWVALKTRRWLEAASVGGWISRDF